MPITRKIVAIVPSAKLFKNDDPYSDKYEFVNSYINRINEVGAIASGVLPNNGYVDPHILDPYDAFVICGGLQIHPYHFSIVEYCYKTQKKLLGVCLGLQAIHSFFVVLEESKKRNWDKSLLELYLQMKKEKHMFVLPIENHWKHNITRDSIDKTKHAIDIGKDTKLYQLIKSNKIYVSSMHRYAINNPSRYITVSARSLDGSIEAIEYGENIIGVQFHPEVDNSLNSLFKFIVS